MVRSLRLTLLVEDSVNPSRKDLKAKHGLSIKADVKKGNKWFSFLMDTWPAPEVVLSNAKALDSDLKQTRAIFLIHGHRDHTGGLVGVLRHIGKSTPLLFIQESSNQRKVRGGCPNR